MVTEAVPGDVIVQHGGTVHDQFAYSYAAATAEENKKTPISLEPLPPGAPTQSFGFLELFVPSLIADVEIVPPADVTPLDQATAWDHPYHAAGSSYFLQPATAPTAAYHPVAGHYPNLEARDSPGRTWEPSGELVGGWIVRPAGGAAGREISLELPGEVTGLTLVFVASGSASVQGGYDDAIVMGPGDALTASGREINLTGPSPDLQLVLIKISQRAEALRERTPPEIQRLKALGPAIITRRLVRPAHDDRRVNFLTDEDVALGINPAYASSSARPGVVPRDRFRRMPPAIRAFFGAVFGLVIPRRGSGCTGWPTIKVGTHGDDPAFADLRLLQCR